MGSFNEIDQAQMDWLMNINFWGVVHGTRAFLPHLAKQREAHIVNLSSIFGIVGPPGQTRLRRGEIRGARLFRKPAP